jgi:hypothetical protein
MDSSFIQKIEKAKDYAVQPDRIKIKAYQAEFRGDNGNHTLTYEGDQWHCDCDYYAGRKTCTHVMTMQIRLEGKVSTEALAS